jgi:polyisoprenyl-phosphate glycosyltransferase
MSIGCRILPAMNAGRYGYGPIIGLQTQKLVMAKESIPILLSIIIVTQNESADLKELIDTTSLTVRELVSDYEIIIIDNGSTDATQNLLRRLTGKEGLPNLQVYSLAGNVDEVTAFWVGIENSLGDVVICLDPRAGDLAYLETVLVKASEGCDLVFTKKVFSQSRRSIPVNIIYMLFGKLLKISSGIDLGSYSSSFLAVSRRVVSYLLQFPSPQLKYRNLPSISGFSRYCVNINPRKIRGKPIRFTESIPRGIKLVTSSSESPLRIATILSAIGAIASLLYSVYIVLIWIFKDDVAPGWVSLSMQQAGMFFLISLVLLVMSEYVLEIARKSNSGPPYYIAQEYTSATLTRKERLNIEVDRVSLEPGRSK